MTPIPPVLGSYAPVVFVHVASGTFITSPVATILELAPEPVGIFSPARVTEQPSVLVSVIVAVKFAGSLEMVMV